MSLYAQIEGRPFASASKTEKDVTGTVKRLPLRETDTKTGETHFRKTGTGSVALMNNSGGGM